MKNKLCLFILFILFINTSKAQNKDCNDRYIEVSVSLIATDIQKALRISDSLLKVSKTDDERAKAYMLSANIYQNLGEKALAIKQATYADDIAKAVLNPAWQAVTAGFLATSFRQIGLFDAARRYVNRAAYANDSFRDNPMYTLTKINIFHEMSLQDMAQNDYESALAKLINAESLINFDENVDKKEKLIKATNHQLLGLCYIHFEKYTEAEKWYTSSLTQLRDVESNLKPYIYKGLALISFRKGDLKKTATYLNYVEPYLNSSGFEDLSLETYQTFSDYYWEIRDLKQAQEYSSLFIQLKNKQRQEVEEVIGELFEDLYSSKESYRNRFKTAGAVMLCLAVVTVFLVVYTFFLNRKTSLRSETIDENINLDIETRDTQITNAVIRDVNMSKETEERLLNNLEKHEDNLFFLEKNISLSSIAESFNTNQRYVSYIIRKYRGKDFYNYIQSSRIQFIIGRIKADSSLLDYKLAHLADLSGFTNLSKFSIAFKAETGLPPSAFVHFTRKELGQKGKTSL